ncbi:MAG: phosphatidylserine/phosphatidylglycerophosphate/cardiolipin synthase family protein [Acidimicrobiia bacterium]
MGTRPTTIAAGEPPRDRPVRPPTRVLLLGAFALVGVLTACRSESSSFPFDGDSDDPVLPPDRSAPVVMELIALDIWAQPLPQDEAELLVTRDGREQPAAGWPEATLPLLEAGRYQVTLSAPGYETMSLDVGYDGRVNAEAVDVRRGEGAKGSGLLVAHAMRDVDGRSVQVHSIYMGLRHAWFSAQGRPARSGNDVTLLMDGEEAWEAVDADLRRAVDRVEWASWWWQSDFELVRDEAGSTPDERRANTIISILDASPAEKRILMNRFLAASVDLIARDDALHERGATPGDGFEFLPQLNPTKGAFTFEVGEFSFLERLVMARPELAGASFDGDVPIASTVPPHEVSLDLGGFDVQAASYHQKFGVIDGRVAYIGGMNTKDVDWDTSDHLVFDPQRMRLGAPEPQREAVANREADPDFGPRKDYMVRIEGPAVQDAEDVFHLRWVHQIEAGATYAENASDFTVSRDQPPIPGGVHAQVTATMPAPFNEFAIAETWFNAVGQAEDYIFIEDQYFRIPMLLDAILARMADVPDLELVVITQPVNRWTDPGCVWSYRGYQEVRSAFPDRLSFYQLRSFDYVFDAAFIDEHKARFVDMATHSKLLVVDDVFLSVGSANKNNRGIVYEGELNLAVHDAEWVKDAMRRVLAAVLPKGTDVDPGSAGWVRQLAEAAAANDAVYEAWAGSGFQVRARTADLSEDLVPHGFLYGLEFGDPADCLLAGVGPDTA